MRATASRRSGRPLSRGSAYFEESVQREELQSREEATAKKAALLEAMRPRFSEDDRARYRRKLARREERERREKRREARQAQRLERMRAMMAAEDWSAAVTIQVRPQLPPLACVPR